MLRVSCRRDMCLREGAHAFIKRFSSSSRCLSRAALASFRASARAVRRCSASAEAASRASLMASLLQAPVDKKHRTKVGTVAGLKMVNPSTEPRFIKARVETNRFPRFCLLRFPRSDAGAQLHVFCRTQSSFRASIGCCCTLHVFDLGATNVPHARPAACITHHGMHPAPSSGLGNLRKLAHVRAQLREYRRKLALLHVQRRLRKPSLGRDEVSISD